jgi:hypothetical protein
MTKIYLDEATIRSRAKRLGYRVHRARWARYALIDSHTNAIVLGHQFNADLEDIDIFLATTKTFPRRRLPKDLTGSQ